MPKTIIKGYETIFNVLDAQSFQYGDSSKINEVDKEMIKRMLAITPLTAINSSEISKGKMDMVLMANIVRPYLYEILH